MYKCFCDRCGREIADEATRFGVSIIRKGTREPGVMEAELADIDLCEDCAGAVAGFALTAQITADVDILPVEPSATATKDAECVFVEAEAADDEQAAASGGGEPDAKDEQTAEDAGKPKAEMTKGDILKERRRRVTELMDAGLSAKKISEELGLPYKTVWNTMQCVKKGRGPKEVDTKGIDRGKVLALHAAGRSAEWIADDMGISTEQVEAVLRES